MNVKSEVLSFMVICVLLVSFLASGQVFAAAPESGYPEFPYTLSNFDEPYRPQFHFTPQSGWMNDVNGIWYHNGVYHLSYQHYPHGTGWDNMHWGHATSNDMIHWVQQPVMLQPDVNVPGMCYSGSTVVDTNNTSGFKTGSNPVFVTIYTATKKGTCLAYSNDLGATWQAYAGNPVAIGGTNENTRDPHVFWYAATSRWICVEYENGITIYSSPDLKSWTRESNFAWGFECPDMFQLAVDGGATKKWILMDAGLSYYIGSFDGRTFTPDAGGPYKMDQNTGIGVGLYAAQTFFINNFPTNRVIQMGWMSGMGQGSTTTWTHNASFPCELKLVTLPEGIRVTRTPISEISSLYGTTQHWNSQTLNGGTNLLGGKLSKTCDIEVVFNVSGAAASKINFQIANQTFAYDLASKTILGKTLNPINNQVKIRILLDSNTMELFGNDGQLSYSQNFAFNPTDSSLSIVPNGNITLVSADYRTLNRAWPKTPSTVYADDADSGVVYNGTWNTVTNDNAYYKNTCKYGNTANGYIQYTFKGTQIEWFGLKNADLGMADVYIDGALAAGNIDCYSTTRMSQLLFSKTGLSNGSHTIKVVVKGTKNAASAGTYLVHDYFAYSAEGSVIDDANAGTTYNGTWSTDNTPTYYGNTCHVGNTTNGYFQYTFTGTQVNWYGLKNVDLGVADVYIDGVKAASVDCYSTTRLVQQLFSKTGLSYGSHTIKVVVTGTKNGASGGTFLVHDFFEVK